MDIVSFWKNLSVVCWYLHKMQEEEEETIGWTREFVSDNISLARDTVRQLERELSDNPYNLPTYISDEERIKISKREDYFRHTSIELIKARNRIEINREQYSQRAGEFMISSFLTEQEHFQCLYEQYTKKIKPKV